jgi:phage shock protein PspC (stress-responsive transcriptional regulator)
MDTTPHSAPHAEDPGLGAGPSTVTEDRPPVTEPFDRLHRVGPGRMVAGVAGGVADYFDVDPTLVRVGFVVLAFMGGLALPAYLAGWLLIPEEGHDHSVAEDLLGHGHHHSAPAA